MAAGGYQGAANVLETDFRVTQTPKPQGKDLNSNSSNAKLNRPLVTQNNPKFVDKFAGCNVSQSEETIYKWAVEKRGSSSSEDGVNTSDEFGQIDYLGNDSTQIDDGFISE